MQHIAHISGSESRNGSRVVMAGVVGPLLPQTMSRKKKKIDLSALAREGTICLCDTELRQLGTGNQERRITAMFGFP